jgi:hypothetical protein
MKQNLLHEVASLWYADKRALALASQSLTAEAIAGQSERLDRRIALAARVFGGLYWVVFLGAAIAGFMLDPVLGAPSAPELVLAVIRALVVGSLSLVPVSALQACVHWLWANKEERELLSPIAGTTYCESALRDLEKGGPQVAQWRDLALAERGQLYRFDGYVMELLSAAHEARIEVQMRQAQVDAACRKVHGLGL